MRARKLFAAGLVAVVAGACSNAPADTAPQIDAQLEANLDRALTGPAEVEQPAVGVASAIEAPRPPETEPEPQRMRRRLVAPSPQPKVEAEVAVAAPEPEPEVEQAPENAEEPTFTLSPWPRTTDVVPAGVRNPPEGNGEQPERRGGDNDDDGANGRRPGRGNGPGVIIRGGVGERDPCAIHFPGGIRIGGITIGGGGRGGWLGPAGTLVNERVPRVGPGQNPVIPAPGGTRGFPGGGPVFQRGSLR